MTASIFQRLIDAALAADLSKNEYKIFLALLRQTIGYGKASDPLTPNRLKNLTGIRKDRLEKAIQGVIKTGIFQRKPHRTFTHQYQINVDYLPKDHTPIYSPSLPKNRNATQQTETKPEKRVHTNTTNTNITPHNNTSGCSRSDRELIKPANLDSNTYQTLLPALGKLKTATAQNILEVLSCAISDQSIKTTPTRLGFCLIKHAIAGLLNTDCLQNKQQQQKKVQINQHHIEKAERAAEINGLRHQAKLLGISLQQHAKNLNQLHLLSGIG